MAPKKSEVHIKTAFLGLIFLASSMFITSSGHAQEPKWVIFDPDYPHDYIDVTSISYPKKSIARFWEKAGEKHEQKGKIIYPQYNLMEINCQERTSRSLRWNMALGDQNSIQGREARMKFIESWTKALGYDPTSPKREPTPWRSIDSNKHSYARFDFVCKGLNDK